MLFFEVLRHSWLLFQPVDGASDFNIQFLVECEDIFVCRFVYVYSNALRSILIMFFMSYHHVLFNDRCQSC